MMFDCVRESVQAPDYWSQSCTKSESKLHQLSPYIGKLKSAIAADLLTTYTGLNDLVLDPFCGSGTVPLEAALLGRRAVAADASMYAAVLTRAKLAPPLSLEAALLSLDRVLEDSRRRPTPDLRSVPQWVRRFFHPET